MDFDLGGLLKAQEAAEESDFPGRHTGCAIGYYDADGDTQWVSGCNEIAVGRGSVVADAHGVFSEEKPYAWTPHAEASAIANAASMGAGLCGSTAYLTGSPCLECAIMLARAGVDLIVISKDDPFEVGEWSIKEGLEFLGDYGVTVVREV